MTTVVTARPGHCTPTGNSFAETIATAPQRKRLRNDHSVKIDSFKPMATPSTMRLTVPSTAIFCSPRQLSNGDGLSVDRKSLSESSLMLLANVADRPPDFLKDLPNEVDPIERHKDQPQLFDIISDFSPQYSKERVNQLFTEFDAYHQFAIQQGADPDVAAGQIAPYTKDRLEQFCFDLVSTYKSALDAYASDTVLRENAYQCLVTINRVMMKNCLDRELGSHGLEDISSIESKRLKRWILELLFERPPAESLSRTQEYDLRKDKKSGPLEWRLSEVESIVLTNRSPYDNPRSLKKGVAEMGFGTFGRVRGAVRVKHDTGSFNISPVAAKKIPLGDQTLSFVLGCYKEIRINQLVKRLDHVVPSERTMLYQSQKGKDDLLFGMAPAEQMLSVMDVATAVQPGVLRERHIDKQLDYFKQAADGLTQLHAKGIIHNDVKLDNCGEKPDGTVGIYDFGNALEAHLSFEDNLVDTNQIGGSYPSPECYRFRGEWDEEPDSFDRTKIDVWGFGVMLLSVFAKQTCLPHVYIEREICLLRKWYTQEQIEAHRHEINQAYFSWNHTDRLKTYCEQVKQERLSDKDGPSDVNKLIIDCLKADPAHRPTMEEVSMRLGQIKIDQATTALLGDLASSIDGLPSFFDGSDLDSESSD